MHLTANTFTTSITASTPSIEQSYMTTASPLGALTIVASAAGISGLYFEQQRYFSGTGNWRNDPEHPHLKRANQQLSDYFNAALTQFDLPLDLQGTQFQLAVWQQLMTIEFGRSVSYGEHARRIGKPAAVRAVGTAIGRNPISIIVPCHRVLGQNGALTGYAGGLERKQFLLALEHGQNRMNA
jgi:methylated-DNA-[protein]-cysteine S-methyltransferase